ncbi:hypothetical protein KIPB_006917 [Kipferlia bialata]|uniref:Uncharacterized protein n=1 Tax=Kipferlia bialata TaxID=797122 RepID=A0A9K3CXR1_9EUKA|nr:hypothetical protein KIPB_006917 [Kipferlia bialata]|eukprot:g6917.t1
MSDLSTLDTGLCDVHCYVLSTKEVLIGSCPPNTKVAQIVAAASRRIQMVTGLTEKGYLVFVGDKSVRQLGVALTKFGAFPKMTIPIVLASPSAGVDEGSKRGVYITANDVFKQCSITDFARIGYDFFSDSEHAKVSPELLVKTESVKVQPKESTPPVSPVRNRSDAVYLRGLDRALGKGTRPIEKRVKKTVPVKKREPLAPKAPRRLLSSLPDNIAVVPHNSAQGGVPTFTTQCIPVGCREMHRIRTYSDCFASFLGYSDRVSDCVFTVKPPHVLAAVSIDGQLTLSLSHNGVLLCAPMTVDDRRQPLYCIRMTRDNRYIYTGGATGAVTCLGLKLGGKVVCTLPVHKGAVTALELAANDTNLYSADSTGSIYRTALSADRRSFGGSTLLTRVRTESPSYVSPSRGGGAGVPITSLSLSSVSESLAYACASGEVGVVNGEGRVTFVSAHAHKHVPSYDPSDPQGTRQYTPMGGRTVVAWLPDSDNLLVSAGSDGLVRMWDVGHKKCLKTIGPFPYGCRCMDIADDKTVSVGTSGGTVYQIDMLGAQSNTHSGPGITTFRAHTGPVTALAYTHTMRPLTDSRPLGATQRERERTALGTTQRKTYTERERERECQERAKQRVASPTTLVASPAESVSSLDGRDRLSESRTLVSPVSVTSTSSGVDRGTKLGPASPVPQASPGTRKHRYLAAHRQEEREREEMERERERANEALLQRERERRVEAEKERQREREREAQRKREEVEAEAKALRDKERQREREREEGARAVAAAVTLSTPLDKKGAGEGERGTLSREAVLGAFPEMAQVPSLLRSIAEAQGMAQIEGVRQ